MEPTLIDGRYLLLGELGRGGEAQVYRARDELTQTDVALRLGIAAGSEAAQQSTLAHENWVDFLGGGMDARYGAYQVFTLLEGCTLRILVESGPLDSAAWRELVDQSLAGVEAVHLAGWVHGDLNADNLFRTESGWKLFELPFRRPQPPPGRSALFGSIHTLAPEQFDGAPADVRTDLYSLGCLYYYAACGSYPHPGANNREVAIHCLCFPPEPLHAKAPGLNASWCDGVMRLVATKRADRPATAAAARQLLAVPVA